MVSATSRLRTAKHTHTATNSTGTCMRLLVITYMPIQFISFDNVLMPHLITIYVYNSPQINSNTSSQVQS